MRTGLILVLALLTSLAGAWVIATYQLGSRVSGVAIDAKALCHAPRGNAPITMKALAERFVVFAEDNALQASDVRIVSAPIGADSKSTTAQVAGSLTNLTHGKLRMTATEVTVSGRLQGKKWLWSVDRDFESTCVLKGKLARAVR